MKRGQVPPVRTLRRAFRPRTCPLFTGLALICTCPGMRGAALRRSPSPFRSVSVYPCRCPGSTSPFDSTSAGSRLTPARTEMCGIGSAWRDESSTRGLRGTGIAWQAACGTAFGGGFYRHTSLRTHAQTCARISPRASGRIPLGKRSPPDRSS